jgi:hypothetical protein
LQSGRTFDIQSPISGLNLAASIWQRCSFWAEAAAQLATFQRGEKTQKMAKTVCKILGVVFLLVGVAGFAAPNLLGAHLTPPHNAIHIVSGVIALYFGFVGSLSGAKGFCLVFGLLYLALGLVGMVLGNPANSRMLQVGPLMLGMADHGIHLLLGAVFLAGGFFTKRT